MIRVRLTRLSLLSLLPILLAACNEASRRPKVTGEGMFLRYCASCHGADGKGHGPVAATLKKAPADLTRIAERAGGKFDEPAVLATIDGRRLVSEHGPRDMPVWGDVFDEELKEQMYTHYTGLLQSRLLVDYLRSIQTQ